MKRAAAVLLALALLAGGGWLARRLAAPPPVLALHLAPEPAAAWTGVSADERAGLLALLQESLELDRRFTLLREQPRGNPQTPCVIWRVSAERRGDELHLRFRDAGGAPTLGQGPPLAAIRGVFSAVGVDTTRLGRLLPEDPAAFWQLAGLSGPFTFPELKSRQSQALALAERNPASAAAWYCAAYASLRLLLVEAAEQTGAHEVCDQLFQKSLVALPDYPRALYQFSRYKTDVGSGRESIELAMRFRHQFPNHPLAYGALAYAARNAGLLEGARTALAARETLVGGLVADPGLGENTYLYSGDLDRFEQSLVSSPGDPPHPLRTFYRAYARLLRGDRAGALPLFHEAQSQPGRIIQFEAMAQIYELALTGQPAEALARLRHLREARTQLRIPDGEFTFKLAEAFAFLGAHLEALEAASSAFGQGFGCTRWYRQAPFLQPLQQLPRWRSQLKHIEERERALAERFPARAFGRQ